MLDKITIENYKLFKDKQELELKPITVLIGKNSFGKSSIAKLPTLLEQSLEGNMPEPLLYSNNGVELGAEFRDLLHAKSPTGVLKFAFQVENDVLEIWLAANSLNDPSPRIAYWRLNQELELKYDDVKRLYINQIDEREYFCVFEGFHLNLLLDAHGNGSSEVPSLKKFQLTADYIGPFRTLPPRLFTLTGKKEFEKLGPKGENTYQILANDFLYYQGQLLHNVSQWYKDNLDGWGVAINDNGNLPFYQLELTKDTSNFNVNIADVGQGMSQALPLVVSACLSSNTPLLTILEQPELHLHPAAHGNLAELFVASISNNRKKYLIETHSQNFVLRLRKLVAEKKLNLADINIYWVDYSQESNSSSLKKIAILESGDVENWPEDIFNETLKETIGIRTAQLKNNAS